jgi:hypothetical protein
MTDVVIHGHAILAPPYELGYGSYTYFAMNEVEANNILDDVRDENLHLQVVPAQLLLSDKSYADIKDALAEFCNTVESAGGLVFDAEEGSGLPAPKGADTWVDLADAYEKACAALHRTPVWDPEALEEDE